jgi:outer membrane protein TolC
LLGLQGIAERNEKALDLARKDSLPDFDVRFSYGQRDSAPDGMRREDMVSFTIAINLPFQRERKIEPRIAEAAAMRYQAIDLYNAQRNETSAKLRQQAATAEQSLKSARLYETGILPQARLGVESSLAAYRVNRVDFLSLLDTQMTVFNLEIAHAAAIAGYNKALAEIDFITGKPGSGEKP